MAPAGRTLRSRPPDAPTAVPAPDGRGRTSAGGLLVRYPVVAVTAVVLVASVGLGLAGRERAGRWLGSAWALLVAARLAVRIVRDLRAGRWGVDVLALTAIGATVAVGEHLAALVVVLMLAGGQALEDHATRRARSELRALLARAPTTAHRLTDDEVVDVPVDDVRVGDRLLVRPAEVVPVDGVLEDDEAELDESSLTGESVPVTHAAGDAVPSGVVNAQAALTLRVTAAAADSQYARILAMVREAEESRAPVVRLADRYAVPFTALALLLAALGWWLHGDPVVAAEVLVVATPCPLLIAAPVAFLSGTSRAAHAGVIVKDAGTLERLAGVRTVAFDKTGTITTGRPQLEGVLAREPWTERDVLLLAASVEQYSSHVLAAAICEAAVERGLVLLPGEDAREEATQGIRARVAGRTVLLGKRRHLAETVPDADADGLELAPGELAVHVAVNGRLAGVLVLSDTPRPDARATVAALSALGVRRTLVLSGDDLATVRHVADAVGIEEVHAECRPEDKVRLLRGMRGRGVLMVGDGINDAPVLAAADVGVAMGARGATAASEAADVVVLTEELSRVAVAVRIGRRTLAVALQSIWLGIGLSVGLMVLAATTGALPAVAGALSQEVVDLVTILYALRARR